MESRLLLRIRNGEPRGFVVSGIIRTFQFDKLLPPIASCVNHAPAVSCGGGLGPTLSPTVPLGAVSAAPIRPISRPVWSLIERYGYRAAPGLAAMPPTWMMPLLSIHNGASRGVVPALQIWRSHSPPRGSP